MHSHRFVKHKPKMYDHIAQSNTNISNIHRPLVKNHINVIDGSISVPSKLSSDRSNQMDLLQYKGEMIPFKKKSPHREKQFGDYAEKLYNY